MLPFYIQNKDKIDCWLVVTQREVAVSDIYTK